MQAGFSVPTSRMAGYGKTETNINMKSKKNTLSFKAAGLKT
jgi:hypothetical protein